MARGSPIPKDPEKRVNRNKRPEFESLNPSVRTAAPALPRSSKYLPETKAWYQVWSRSPQAQKFGTTDWQSLHMLAPIVDRYFRTARKGEATVSLLAEIRRVESSLGATPADRQRLRWRIGGVSNMTEEEAPPLVPRRGRAAGARADPRLRAVGE